VSQTGDLDVRCNNQQRRTRSLGWIIPVWLLAGGITAGMEGAIADGGMEGAIAVPTNSSPQDSCQIKNEQPNELTLSLSLIANQRIQVTWKGDTLIQPTRSLNRFRRDLEKALNNRERNETITRLKTSDNSERRKILMNLLLNTGYVTSEIPDEKAIELAADDTILHFNVIPGQLTSIAPQGLKPGIAQDPESISPQLQSYICRRMKLGVDSDTPLNVNHIEDQLRLLNIDPIFDRIEGTLEATGTRKETDSKRESRLKVRVVKNARVDRFFLTGNVGIDNASPPSVGSARGSVELQFLNIGFLGFPSIGIGHELTAGYSNSFIGKNETLSFNYRAPLGAINNSLQLRYSRTRNKLAKEAGDVAELGIQGRSESYEINYRHPLWRNPRSEFALSGGLIHQQGQTFLFDRVPFPFGKGPDRDGNSRTSVIGLGADYFQRSPSGSWFLSSQLRIGTGLFSATTNDEPTPDGHFLSWVGQVQRIQRLSPDWLLVMQAAWQLTPDSLLPSEQFVIGGQQTLRGYRQNARYGDSGFRVLIEPRIKIRPPKSKVAFKEDDKPQLRPVGRAGLLLPTNKPRAKDSLPKEINFTLAPFFNAGTVWNRHNNPNTLPEQRFLAGVGIGLIIEEQWFAERQPRWSFRLDYGLPLVDSGTRGGDIQDSGLYFTFRYNF
jgi:hemolysin activation/secretion protein